MGGIAFSPLLATLFLGIGAGAICQVIVEVGNLVRLDAEKQAVAVFSWMNVAALLTGMGIMYLTALLVNWRLTHDPSNTPDTPQLVPAVSSF